MDFTDKENMENIQVLGRKPGLLDTSAPRTPLASVCNQRAFQTAADNAEVSKPSDTLKCFTSVSDSSLKLKRKADEGSNTGFLWAKSKPATPLRKKVFQVQKLRKAYYTERSGIFEDGGADVSSSMPASPVAEDPRSFKDTPAVTSQSCPDLLSGVALPVLNRTEPLDAATAGLRAPKSTALSGIYAEASLGCEMIIHGKVVSASCGTDGKKISRPNAHVGEIKGEEDMNLKACSMKYERSCKNTADISVEELLNPISVQTDFEKKQSVHGSQETCYRIVQSVMENLLTDVIYDLRHSVLHADIDPELAALNINNSAVSFGDVPDGGDTAHCKPKTFMQEYTRFLELQTQEMSPAFASLTSSLTDVTPFSTDRGQDLSTFGKMNTVALESMASFCSESNDSLSSSISLEQQLHFKDSSSLNSLTDLDESLGFVRSSESQFDLRDETALLTSREEPLTNCDQGMEFLCLPSPSTLHRHAPVFSENLLKCHSPSPPEDSVSCLAFSMSDAALTNINSGTMLSKAPKNAEKSYSLLKPPNDASRLVLEMHDVALSPILNACREMDVNTSITDVSDASTSTQVSVVSVALSPIIPSSEEKGMMTVATEKTDVSLVTESRECLEQGVLAKTETDCKMTMTDQSTSCHSATTMTPLKLIIKKGKRLTSEEIRKQHPRILANQLETLTISNMRLESELREMDREKKQLQGTLKDARKLITSQQTGTKEDSKINKLLEGRELQLREQCQKLEGSVAEYQCRIAALEAELASLRSEAEKAKTLHQQEILALEEKCLALEECNFRTSQQFEQEIQEQVSRQEVNSYYQQFQHAQQIVREQQAEICEIRGLFHDIQQTAEKLEKVNSLYKEVHCKISTLAKENYYLRNLVDKRAFLSKEEVSMQRSELDLAHQENTQLLQQVDSLTQTLTITHHNLAQLEKVYSVSTDDLLLTTGQVVQLNTELFTAKKTIQEHEQSKEVLSKRICDLEEALQAIQEDNASLNAAIDHANEQIQEQTIAHHKLQLLSQKMRKMYEVSLENMELGVENLQRTLESRELDIDHLEKDLYECRNIIVEQRYKIDGLESRLREVTAEAQHERAEEEKIEFLKESNALLEAERALYVQTLRDLEDRVKIITSESAQQQVTLTETKTLVESLQQEKVKLMSELAAVQTDHCNASQALTEMEVEHARVESVAVATANDVLEQMHIMLQQLKQKIGHQEVPELYVAEARIRHRLAITPSRSMLSKRHSCKSFVSKILGAASTQPEAGRAIVEMEEEDDGVAAETGSYVGEQDSDEWTRAPASCPPTYPSPSSLETFARGCIGDVGVGTGRSAFTPMSSAGAGKCLPVPNLCHPPASEPTSAFARIRAIPKLKRRSEQCLTHAQYHEMEKKHSLAMACTSNSVASDGEDVSERENPVLLALTALQEVFTSITRLASILDRATYLSLQDLREENDMLRERTEILEERMERSSIELGVCRQESVAKDKTIIQLKQQASDMTQHLTTLRDQTFDIKRLSVEVQRLETLREKERQEKEVVSGELEALLQQLEGRDGGAGQARCMRDVLALKKKNQQLVTRLEEQREHYEELGAKAARRMGVLDDNWKKAEDEVYRLDELVESIKEKLEAENTKFWKAKRVMEMIEHQSPSSSPSVTVRHIMRLIGGEGNSSPPM